MTFVIRSCSIDSVCRRVQGVIEATPVLQTVAISSRTVLLSPLCSDCSDAALTGGIILSNKYSKPAVLSPWTRRTP